jgi:hypothetical protein
MPRDKGLGLAMTGELKVGFGQLDVGRFHGSDW